MTSRMYIGTSGWMYKHWAASFYPKGIGHRHLEYYAKHFPTVEINATHYRLPSDQAIAAWRAQAPPGFLYAVKGSRTVTHYFRLRPGSKSLPLLLERIEGLGEHLGPVLWQLPPTLRFDPARLEGFLAALPRGRRHAIEFRHPSWLVPETFSLLRRFAIASVSVSAAWFPADHTITTDFVYLRFHGLEGGFAHDYTDDELRPWVEHLQHCAKSHLTSFAYFNNDANTRAPYNALRLMELLAG